MKTITLGSSTVSYADGKFTRLVNRNAEAMGYKETVPNPTAVVADPDTPANPHNIPNPEAKEEFVLRMLDELLVENVVAVEATKDAGVARKLARDKAKSDFGR